MSVLRAAVVSIALVSVATACTGDEPALRLDPSRTTTTAVADTQAAETTAMAATSPPSVVVTTSPTTTSPAGPGPLGPFFLGGNLPWYQFGCDFGCGRDGGGASSPEVSDVVGRAIADASAAGLTMVRWWMFPGTPTQITSDSAGLPTGIDPRVYEDVDAALALAEQHGVRYIFTLFSSPAHIPPAWLATDEARQRLADVLGELFGRYRDDPLIHTWQVVNEPEWAIWGGEVALEAVQDLVRRVAQAVHERSSALVSVGGARLDGLEMWNDLGLDYRTVHWYDYMTNEWDCVPCTTFDELVEEREFDGAVLVGEFNLSSDIDGEARLAELRNGNWAGALAWSLLPDRTTDQLNVNLAAVETFLAGGG